MITRDLISKIKIGSVIVDVAIDPGGCAETVKATTHAEPTYTVDDVVHYCVANMPEGFDELLTMMREEYGNPTTYITENGVAYFDQVKNGVVDDQPRISYLKNHIETILRQKEKGSDVRGYFAWSLLDNFEWAKGFSTRFGLRMAS